VLLFDGNHTSTTLAEQAHSMPPALVGDSEIVWINEFAVPRCIDFAVWADFEKMQVFFKEAPEHEMAAQFHTAGLYRF
jgi:hypothetical protein